MANHQLCVKTGSDANIVHFMNELEGYHRRIKRLIQYGLWFGNFRSAQKTISGYEAIHMVRKGQTGIAPERYLEQVKLVESLFNTAI